jgi:hypothetical protein
VVLYINATALKEATKIGVELQKKAGVNNGKNI